MDGRDIGTVILPEADVKIFLTASEECRAQRRYKELIARGQNVTLEDVLVEMNQRDTQDSTRECAPTAAADDAILLDNTGMTFDQTVDAIVCLAKKTQKI
jgi:cytidylate kinase